MWRVPLLALLLASALLATGTPALPLRAAAAIVDTDGDGVADASDNCPTTPNASQANLDGDTLGDACDGDGWSNSVDAFPRDGSEQVDTDRPRVSATTYKVVATRQVAAAKGANRLVLRDLRSALAPGRYRVDVRPAGSRTALARLMLTVPAAPRTPPA